MIYYILSFSENVFIGLKIETKTKSRQITIYFLRFVVFNIGSANIFFGKCFKKNYIGLNIDQNQLSWLSKLNEILNPRFLDWLEWTRPKPIKLAK